MRRKSAVRADVKRRAPALRRTAKTPPALMKPAEVSAFLDQLQAQEKSESAWREMTAPLPDEQADRWSEVQEHLLMEAYREEGQLRRWKYFGK